MLLFVFYTVVAELSLSIKIFSERADARGIGKFKTQPLSKKSEMKIKGNDQGYFYYMNQITDEAVKLLVNSKNGLVWI